MRITSKSLFFPLALLALTACATEPPEPAPAPQPTKPVATTTPASAVIQPKGEWIDWPITPGAWVYREDARGSLALFGQADRDATFIVRCDKSHRKLFLSRSGSLRNGTKMILRASSGLQSYTAGNTRGKPDYAAVSVSPGDIMMDRISYSRGRFAVEASGLRSLAIPVWPEFSRVVEDCRA